MNGIVLCEFQQAMEDFSAQRKVERVLFLRAVQPQQDGVRAAVEFHGEKFIVHGETSGLVFWHAF